MISEYYFNAFLILRNMYRVKAKDRIKPIGANVLIIKPEEFNK